MSNPLRINIKEILELQSDALKMRLLAGEKGLHRYIDHPRLQKPSLAFAGFLENLSDYRLQVIGQTELHYLETLPTETKYKAVDAVFDLKLAGVVVTRSVEVPDFILEAAKRTDTPLISSALSSSEFMTDMTVFLSHKLAPVTHQHGVYLDIFGIGVLLRGDSGIGKSEIGLELIAKGHRLIADDMVELVRETPKILVGRSPKALRYHIEIRGLGILDVRSVFGAAAITDTKRVRLVIDLMFWSDKQNWDRLATDDEVVVHEVSLPRVRLPVQTGRSIAVLVEVATRNQLLKQRGFNSSEIFAHTLQQRIQKNSENL